MAYQFDETEDEDEKQSIFGQDIELDGQQGLGLTGTGTAGAIETSSSAPVSSGGSSRSSATNRSSVNSSDLASPRKTPMASTYKYKGPQRQLENISEGLNKASENLQAEAQAYSESDAQKAGQRQISSEDIRSAVGGDTAAGERLGGLLSGGYTPPQETFNAQDIATPDADLLKTESGIGELIRRDVGGQYTGADRAFDMAMLRRNPDFQQQRQNVIGQAQNLQGQESQLEQDVNTQAKARDEADYNYYQQEARDVLGGLRDEYLGAQQPEMETFIAQQNALARQQMEQQAQEYVERLLRGEESVDPGTGRVLPTNIQEIAGGVDPMSFVQETGDLNTDMFIDDEEAAALNRLESFLGTDTAYQPSVEGPREASYDMQAFIDEISNRIRGASTEAPSELPPFVIPGLPEPEPAPAPAPAAPTPRAGTLAIPQQLAVDPSGVRTLSQEERDNLDLERGFEGGIIAPAQSSNTRSGKNNVLAPPTLYNDPRKFLQNTPNILQNMLRGAF